MRNRSFVRNVVGFVGMGVTAYGAWLVYHPAGFIIGGVLLVASAALDGWTQD